MWALFDRDPLPRWSEDRVVLLGDACHPMPPFQAQGAAMAIEDAIVLAKCLQAHGVSADVRSSSYEQLRKPRTSKVLASARANMGVFHRSNALTQAATYGPMKLADRLFPDFRPLAAGLDLWLRCAQCRSLGSWLRASLVCSLALLAGVRAGGARRGGV